MNRNSLSLSPKFCQKNKINQICSPLQITNPESLFVSHISIHVILKDMLQFVIKYITKLYIILVGALSCRLSDRWDSREQINRDRHHVLQ